MIRIVSNGIRRNAKQIWFGEREKQIRITVALHKSDVNLVWIYVTTIASITQYQFSSLFFYLVFFFVIRLDPTICPLSVFIFQGTGNWHAFKSLAIKLIKNKKSVFSLFVSFAEERQASILIYGELTLINVHNDKYLVGQLYHWIYSLAPTNANNEQLR